MIPMVEKNPKKSPTWHHTVCETLSTISSKFLRNPFTTHDTTFSACVPYGRQRISKQSFEHFSVVHMCPQTQDLVVSPSEEMENNTN